MRFIIYLLFLFSSYVFSQITISLQTPFEKGNGNQSANYKECITYYKNLDDNFATIKMIKKGKTDSGEPLHIVVFSANKNFNFKQNKAKILINNGIHAGEPDGIDASMLLMRDLATRKIKIPKNTLVVVIPIYSIGGALNRNSTSRTNQNGPEEYGFRGNARNYDLNRDFIKSDTRNTKSFKEIYHEINPEIFIDNHVSNGADYQYVLTYIMTEANKLGKPLGAFLQNEMMPSLVADLKIKNTETTPYVNVWNGTPKEGFSQFFESPRYTTGYTSLYNTIGFVVETHMLKEYSKRVKATYDFMVSTLDYCDLNFRKIQEKRLENQQNFLNATKYPIKWEIDSLKVIKIPFLGYEGSYKKSDVTTGERLFYDKNKPYNELINFYGNYKPIKEVIIPKAYIIPKEFWDVIDLIKEAKIAYSVLKKDSIITVESYKIADYKTYKNAYEGHYPHYDTQVQAITEKVMFSEGDYLIETNQNGIKFLLETLEPEAVDSYFNWNFFDTILQQKEGYSDYVFEDLANDFLNKNPNIRLELQEKIKSDPAFVKNHDAQLEWIHKKSPYYEKAHLHYPIYRVLKN
jgi:Zinc carboxypeptidase